MTSKLPQFPRPTPIAITDNPIDLLCREVWFQAVGDEHLYYQVRGSQFRVLATQSQDLVARASRALGQPVTLLYEPALTEVYTSPFFPTVALLATFVRA